MILHPDFEISTRYTKRFSAYDSYNSIASEFNKFLRKKTRRVNVKILSKYIPIYLSKKNNQIRTQVVVKIF